MDDAAFARFLVARGRLPQLQIQGVLLGLPPGTRLAQGLVGSGLLSVEEARRLWAEAEAGSVAPPSGDQTLIQPLAGPAGAGAPADGLPALGSLVGQRYRLEAELGRGGMGAVYRAHDVTHGRNVALKMILPSLADVVSLERFSREAQLAARVDRDQGVVRVLDFGVHGDAPYCAMELVEGRDLAQVFEDEGPLEVARLLRLLASVADTLGVCHGAGVVHRDLKPANVMVTPQDATKLADFGLARDSELEKLTQTGDILGTPSYMAPEQADQASSVDGRADIYALGAILYRGLTGQPPFEGAVHTVIRDLLLREPPAPRKLRPELSRDVEAICLQAMAKDPDARYQDAASFADDLRRAAEGAPVQARPQSAWARFRSRYRRGVGRTRTKIHGGLFLGLTFLLGGGFLATRSLALARVADYRIWAQDQLEPFAYGLGPEPGFTRADLERWRGHLAWTGPFTSEGAGALETLAAHQLIFDSAAGSSPPAGEPANPAERVALASIALDAANRAAAEGSRRGGKLRERALGWIAPKDLASADPQTQLVGARLRLRLELYAPDREPIQRLRLAAERIAEEPTLAEEAREAATRALAQGLREALASSRTEPGVARRLRELAQRCGGEVLRRGTEQGLTEGAEAWVKGFDRERSKRAEWLTVLGSVCGHSEAASRPPRSYQVAFHEALFKLEMRSAIRLCQRITAVDPAFQADERLYERLQERVAKSGKLDLDLILFSLRTLPGGSSGKFIPPSLRSALDRLPDPEGPDAPFEGRYGRFVDYFKGLLENKPRFRRSKGLRLLTLVAMRRAAYHKNSKTLPEFVAIGREICTGRAGDRVLLDDLAASWRGIALLSLADGLCEVARQLDQEKNDPQRSAPEREALEARIQEAVDEAMRAAREAEGKVKPQYAGAPFSMQAELTRDPQQRLAIFERAESSLRQDLTKAQAAGLYTTFHYEEALVTVLRRRAREYFQLRRYDDALPVAVEAARMARKASGLKQNQDLDGALAVQAAVYRERKELDKAEEVLSERLDVGLQTETFAYVAAQVARDKGDLEEARRRARVGIELNPRNHVLRGFLADLERTQREQED
jgi:protein kinase-like protein